MRPRVAVCTLLLFVAGCAHMVEMEAKRWNDFQQRVSSLNDWELESLHRDIRQRIDRIQFMAPLTVATSSPFELGVAEGQIQDIQQQRLEVEAEMKRRGNLVPGTADPVKEFLRSP